MIFRTETFIDAPPEAVWHVLVAFGRYPAWNPFLRSVDGRAAPGGTLVVRARFSPLPVLPCRATIDRFIPCKELGWRTELLPAGLFSASHRFELRPLPGGTLLLHHEVFSGLFSFLPRLLAGPFLNAYRSMNEALAREAVSP